MKLGGSVLRDRKAFTRAAEIVERRLGNSKHPVCVVSAMKGVTDSIIEALERCLEDSSCDPKGFIQGLLNHHTAILPKGVDISDDLVAEFEKLLHVLSYVKASGELGDSAYAYAVSRGENYSSHLLAAHLEDRGIESRPFYGEDLIITDENVREAAVDQIKTRKTLSNRLMPALEGGVVPVIAGFAGRSPSGKVTVLGRGGTDDTAVHVAFGLGVRRAVKYVLEDGIMTVDPKFFDELETHHPEILARFKLPKPRIVPYLSYVEASELLREERTKVVHYKVLDPLMEGGIELQIKNYYDEDSEGTVIGLVEEAFFDGDNAAPKAISYQRALQGVTVLPSQSATPSEVYAKVFTRLAHEGVDIRYVSTSGCQMSFLMPQEDQARALEALKDLDIVLEVSPMRGSKGTFSVVGSEMRGARGFFSRLTGVLAHHGINIEQATQPNSENIIRFSIDDDDIPLAVAAVYSEFFR